MFSKTSRIAFCALAALWFGVTSDTGLFAQLLTVPFKSDQWVHNDSSTKVESHLGKESLFIEAGTSLVKRTALQDGVIEVDIAPSAERVFAGVAFRAQSSEELELIYLRLHKSGSWDAMQYTPRFHGNDAWQLHSGEGYTAQAVYSRTDWTHIKIAVNGLNAKVYIDNADTPALVVAEMKRDYGQGMVGLWALNGARFANFRYALSEGSTSAAERKSANLAAGIITQWEISPAFAFEQMNVEHYPKTDRMSSWQWQRIESEATGIVNLSRFRRKGHLDRDPFKTSLDAVFARAVIFSEKDQVKKLCFGYSDRVSLFLNGRILFSANSTFRQRDPQFLGIVGLHDAVFLDLKKGRNELLLAVTELFGGWGYICRLDDVEAEARLRLKFQN